MVYELCVEAAQFLARNNTRKFESFAEEREEMRRTEEEAAARKERGQRTLRNIERQAFAAQVAERQRERLEEERQLEEAERRRISECLEETSDQPSVIVSASRSRRKHSIVEESELEPVETSLSIQGVRSSVILGKLLGRNSLGQKTRVGFSVSSGRILAVSEWQFSLGVQRGKKIQFVDLSESNISKQLLSLEQEMNSLVKLKHPNLVPYYGFNSSQSSKSLDVFISQEFVAGVDVSCYLSGDLVMELDMIRQLCGDILSGLSCLHGANIVHRDIRDTSIFLSSQGTFRLADFSLDRRIREMLQEVNNVDVEEVFPPSVGRGGKKSDIYRVGILVLSLREGSVTADQYPDIPAGLSPVFRDFLQCCLTTAERERWTAEELLEHQFIRDPVQRLSLGERNQPHLLQEKIKSRSPSPPPASSYLSASSQAQSRLRQDFEILSWLGRGGFGDVIKVKNKLDEKLYAIKRIRLNPADKATNRKIMREVKLLSRLNHENVVRYYNSWQEITTFPDETGHTETSEGPTETGEGQTHSCSLSGPNFRPPTRASQGGDGSLEWSVSFMPASTDSEEDTDSEEEEELHGPTVREVENTNSFIVFDTSKSESEECEVTDSENVSSSVSSGSVVKQFHNMYIQMEFCDKQTLRNCIDNNLYKDTAKVWRMFREIVEGLVHIHTQGMIHRDLKPVNIFIDSSDNVKIGDFGLATTGMMNTRDDIELSCGEAEAERNNMITIQDDLTGQIGTALYVAPELANSRVTTYNQKVDLYSLGIILFEMSYPPLNTGMERIQVLTRLRSADVSLPDDWEEVGSAQQSYLLVWLLDHDPLHRPTSAELAQSDWLPPLLVEESTMQTMVRNAMKDTSSRAYKHLISAVIGQPMAPARDVDYDTETAKMTLRLAAAHKEVTETCRTVVERHGALPVDSPHLLPKSKGEDWVYSATDNVVQVGLSVSVLPALYNYTP